MDGGGDQNWDGDYLPIFNPRSKFCKAKKCINGYLSNGVWLFKIFYFYTDNLSPSN